MWVLVQIQKGLGSNMGGDLLRELLTSLFHTSAEIDSTWEAILCSDPGSRPVVKILHNVDNIRRKSHTFHCAEDVSVRN